MLKKTVREVHRTSQDGLFLWWWGIDVRQIFYIDTNKKGNLPPRVVGLVMEWAELHKDELLNNWNSLTETGNYSKIAPLV